MVGRFDRRGKERIASPATPPSDGRSRRWSESRADFSCIQDFPRGASSAVHFCGASRPVKPSKGRGGPRQRQPGAARPGVSSPVETRAPFELLIGSDADGAMLDRVLRSRLTDASWNQIRGWVRQGKATVNEQKVLEPAFALREGDRVKFLPKAHLARTRAVALDGRLVYQDSQLVVVDKPSGLSTVPFEESERNSLDRLLAAHLGIRGRPARVHVVHRLDKGTSGLLVFARTDSALKHLKSQFRFHHTQRKYEALVKGHAPSTTYQSRLIADRGDGRRGSVQNPLLGRLAVTHVTLLEKLRGASHIECRLETGRTHQIRIHLAEAGFPLLGERVYATPGDPADVAAERVMLHARELGFTHPATGTWLEFQCPPPLDFAELLSSLRTGAP